MPGPVFFQAKFSAGHGNGFWPALGRRLGCRAEKPSILAQFLYTV